MPNNDSKGVQEWAGTTPWVYIQGLVHKGLRVIHRAQRIGRLHRCCSAEIIKINSLLSFYLHLIFLKLSKGTVAGDL
jgi:hypothetical protein